MPAFHQCNPCPKPQSLAQVVGHEDHGFLEPLLQLQKFTLQFVARKRVECAEGLIHKENRWIRGQGARHADSLPLSSRKLMRIARRQARLQPNQLQQFLNAAANPFFVPAFNLRNESNISFDREMRKQTHVLDHIANASPQANDVAFGVSHAVHEDLTGTRRD